MGDRSESVRAAMAGIVHYLGMRPGARDTAEGIRRWWLSARDGALTEEDVEAALDQLLQHGRITRMTLPDGSYLYAGSEPQPERADKN